MTSFSSPAEELTATQEAAEELLLELSAPGSSVSEHALGRLERLAASCAKLAYGNKLHALLHPSVDNLIAWCDHLNEPRYRAAFVRALKVQPLPPLGHGA